jgi:hypothetical protein
VVSHTFPHAGTYTVTLALADTDQCSVFGPFTGQSPSCISDPAAIFSHAITVPAPPSASGATLTGVARGRPKLAFTLTAGALAASLSTIAVNLPAGLTWSTMRKNLTHHITVTGANGKPARFTAAVRRGALTVTLASIQASVKVTIANPELLASKRLVNEVKPRKSGKQGKRVKRHRPVRLTFKLKLTDAARDAVNLLIRATAA